MFYTSFFPLVFAAAATTTAAAAAATVAVIDLLASVLYELKCAKKKN